MPVYMYWITWCLSTYQHEVWKSECLVITTILNFLSRKFLRNMAAVLTLTFKMTSSVKSGSKLCQAVRIMACHWNSVMF